VSQISWRCASTTWKVTAGRIPFKNLARAKTLKAALQKGGCQVAHQTSEDLDDFVYTMM